MNEETAAMYRNAIDAYYDAVGEDLEASAQLSPPGPIAVAAAVAAETDAIKWLRSVVSRVNDNAPIGVLRQSAEPFGIAGDFVEILDFTGGETVTLRNMRTHGTCSGVAAALVDRWR